MNAQEISQIMARIEAKLDALLEALADEGEETGIDVMTLDGQTIVARERDDSRPL